MNRPTATQSLPEGYRLIQSLNLIKDSKLLLTLSLASIGLFVGTFVGLGWLFQWLRPDVTSGVVGFSISITGIPGILSPFLVIIGVTLVMLIVHEAIHGIFFKVFTGGRVKFAFKGAYAYAAAPDWYLPKKPYMVISLAPLVLMTAGGLLALVWVPLNWITPIILLLAMNASGAVGDLYVFLLLTHMEHHVLIQDFGEKMNIYALGDEAVFE
jgi:hypothetical protein